MAILFLLQPFAAGHNWNVSGRFLLFFCQFFRVTGYLWQYWYGVSNLGYITRYIFAKNEQVQRKLLYLYLYLNTVCSDKSWKIMKVGLSTANFVVFKPQKHPYTKTSSDSLSKEHLWKSKKKRFLWICSFLRKNQFNFSPLKLHNQYWVLFNGWVDR